MRLAALAFPIALAACGGPGFELPDNSATRAGIVLAPDEAGLGIEGSSQRMDFGRAPDGVITIMTREFGAYRTLGIAACASGVMRQLAWREMVLTFSGEQFVGWRTPESNAGAVCL